MQSLARLFNGKTFFRYIGFLLVLTGCMPDATLAQFYTYRTNNMRLVYYDPQASYILPHIGRCFEHSLRFHQKLFDYTPSEDITVFLNDMNDYGSGGANSIPWNYLSIGIEPFDYVYETVPTNERMNWMMIHELAHIVDLDKAAGRDKFFRSLFFGKVAPTSDNPISMGYSYLTNPRYYSPRWFHEGAAVFLETWMTGGIGRTLGGYDEMTFRAMVLDSTYFYDFVGLESEGKTIDFQIGANSYLYGTRFISYLANSYGPEKIVDWLNRSEGSDAYFASQFTKLYGLDIDDAWSRWIAFEQTWQRENLDSIRKYPVTPERQVTDAALGSVSRAFHDVANGRIYVAANYPGRIAHIAAIDVQTGKKEDICDVPTPALYYVASLAYDDSSKSIFYTTHNGQLWRDLNVVNALTGESSLLIKYARTGDLAFNPADNSLWGVRHSTGFSTLVRIPKPYKDIYEIQTLEYGKDIFDLDISPDGTMLTASYIQINGRQQLIAMDIPRLLQGDQNVEVLYEFENNAPANFTFSRDGKFLYGTSYFSGVSNVFRLDITSKKMDAVSNCETGYFRPLPIGNDSLLVFRYTGSGFLPVVIPVEIREDISAIKYLGQEIVEKYPIVKSWNIGSPLSINIDSLKIYSGDYNEFEHFSLSSAYPVVQGFKDFVSYGLTFNFADRIGLHNAELTGTYSPNRLLPGDERIHLALNYRYALWKFSAAYNKSDFYDLFGPTKTSRKGYSASINYTSFIINDRPTSLDYSITLAGYGGLERLPDFQNVSTSFDKFGTLSGSLRYKRVLRTIGAVDVEKGVQWNLHAGNTLVRKRVFSRFHTNFDYGFILPVDHMAVWLRSSFGFSPGDRDDPFANFYFGGFGNNWVDYQEVKRYRSYYTFPGVELNELGGTNFGKLMLEVTTPALRFKRLGVPNFYCTWAHLTFFSSGIILDMDNAPTQRKAMNIGSQIDFKFVLFTNLESTFSLGYAAAFEKAYAPRKEFMISLKIL